MTTHSLLFFLPIISVLVLYAARMRELSAKRDVIRGEVHENLTLRLFVLIGTAVFVGSIVEYWWAERGISWPLFALGWVSGLSSFWLRRKAITALGKFWSLHVEIRDNHEFVRSGPFRFVRHPAYLSMVLELLAFALICNAYLPLIIIPLAFVPVLWMRIRLEERALVAKFGQAYADYQRSTPALFPRPW